MKAPGNLNNQSTPPKIGQPNTNVKYWQTIRRPALKGFTLGKHTGGVAAKSVTGISTPKLSGDRKPPTPVCGFFVPGPFWSVALYGGLLGGPCARRS